MRKQEWEQSLYHMQIENLLHLRDAIIANICIHKMVSDDSSDNLMETEKIVSTKVIQKHVGLGMHLWYKIIGMSLGI